VILRWGTNADKVQYIKGLQKEATRIVEGVVSLIYYMRGAVSYTEAMYMTYAERQIMSDFLEQRFEHESKRMYPVY
jgi:hypothetical protein